MYNDLAELDVAIGKRYDIMSIFFKLQVLSRSTKFPVITWMYDPNQV